MTPMVKKVLGGIAVVSALASVVAGREQPSFAPAREPKVDTRLQVRDVRRYRDLDIELAPGLTVVRGPNEAGKTTIQRILELSLTRKATSANTDLDGLRPWDADAEARPWVRLCPLQEPGRLRRDRLRGRRAARYRRVAPAACRGGGRQR